MSLFENIPPAALSELLMSLNARRVTFKKDMTILTNLNNINEVGIVLSGSASLLRIDYNGNRTVVAILKKDELFGGCFSDYMNEEMSVIATSETEIMFIEYDRLLNINENNTPYHETIIENMIKILVEKINLYNRRIEILTRRSIREKLLAYFHILEKEQASAKITLPYTYTTLADYLAVDRSALMREIKNLKDEGIIDTHSKNITLIYR